MPRKGTNSMTDNRTDGPELQQLRYAADDARAATEALALVAAVADGDLEAAAHVIDRSDAPGLLALALGNAVVHLVAAHLGHDPVVWADTGRVGARDALLEVLAELADAGDTAAEAEFGELVADDLEGLS